MTSESLILKWLLQLMRQPLLCLMPFAGRRSAPSGLCFVLTFTGLYGLVLASSDLPAEQTPGAAGYTCMGLHFPAILNL